MRRYAIGGTTALGEHAARILLAARALGRVNRITPEQIDVLERMRGMSSHGQKSGY
jgi:hypothetical protein